jgi:hypothetical protein
MLETEHRRFANPDETSDLPNGRPGMREMADGTGYAAGSRTR